MEPPVGSYMMVLQPEHEIRAKIKPTRSLDQDTCLQFEVTGTGCDLRIYGSRAQLRAALAALWQSQIALYLQEAQA